MHFLHEPSGVFCMYHFSAVVVFACNSWSGWIDPSGWLETIETTKERRQEK